MILEPQELWKRASKYVEVSTFGRKRVRGNIVDVRIGPNGYYEHKLHRLVAKAFVPNPFNKSEVHHIDGCRTNNHVSNLMWVTRQENMNDPIRRERLSKALRGKPQPNVSKALLGKSQPKLRKQIRVWNDRGYSWIFPSLREAGRILNLKGSSLSRVASGKYKHTKGYHAEYI